MTKDEIFTIKDLYPKKVCDKEGNEESFDENRILTSLKKIGLDKEKTEKVLESVIRKIIGLGIDIITTNTIQELIDNALLEY